MEGQKIFWRNKHYVAPQNLHSFHNTAIPSRSRNSVPVFQENALYLNDTHIKGRRSDGKS